MSDFDTCPRSTLGHDWETIMCDKCNTRCAAKCKKCGYIDRGCR